MWYMASEKKCSTRVFLELLESLKVEQNDMTNNVYNLRTIELMCVIGEVTMSISQSAANPPFEEDSNVSLTLPFSTRRYDKEKIVGCIYLMAAVFVLSSMVVLQATTLSDFPAPLSFCVITSLIGVIITVAGELFKAHQIIQEWPVMNVRTKELLGYSLLAGLISGASISFNAWAMNKRGPVMVSMFSPISAIITVIYSATCGDPVKFGSNFRMWAVPEAKGISRSTRIEKAKVSCKGLQSKSRYSCNAAVQS